MRLDGARPNLAAKRWNDFHVQLHALASTRGLAAYISRIQLAGTGSEIWELIFSTKHRDVSPAQRRLLLRQLAWDIAHGASGASMARALMAVVLWPELDALFERFHQRFPACELLPKLVVDALGIAVCQLRQPLADGAELDVERDILAGTLFNAGRLVGDLELRRGRHVTRVEATRSDDDTDPDIRPTTAMAVVRSAVTMPVVPDPTVSMRVPRLWAVVPPPVVPPPPPPPPPPGTFRPLPGFFLVADLTEVLDFEHEFRFTDGGFAEDGAKLVAVSLRLPIASSTQL